MKKIVSLFLLAAMLMTSMAAVAENDSKVWNLDVFLNQPQRDNSAALQYSVELDDMDATGMITLARESDYNNDCVICYDSEGRFFYKCEPCIGMANCDTAQFWSAPLIDFYYYGENLYIYDTAIFKIGDARYTFNDNDISSNSSTISEGYFSLSMCICDSDDIEFMDAWIANGTAPIKVRLKGDEDSYDFYFPQGAQADTLLMFQNFKDAGGYAFLY